MTILLWYFHLPISTLFPRTFICDDSAFCGLHHGAVKRKQKYFHIFLYQIVGKSIYDSSCDNCRLILRIYAKRE